MSVINFQAARDRKLGDELAALIWFILARTTRRSPLRGPPCMPSDANPGS